MQFHAAKENNVQNIIKTKKLNKILFDSDKIIHAYIFHVVKCHSYYTKKQTKIEQL